MFGRELAKAPDKKQTKYMMIKSVVFAAIRIFGYLLKQAWIGLKFAAPRLYNLALANYKPLIIFFYMIAQALKVFALMAVATSFVLYDFIAGAVARLVPNIIRFGNEIPNRVAAIAAHTTYYTMQMVAILNNQVLAAAVRTLINKGVNLLNSIKYHLLIATVVQIAAKDPKNIAENFKNQAKINQNAALTVAIFATVGAVSYLSGVTIDGVKRVCRETLAFVMRVLATIKTEAIFTAEGLSIILKDVAAGAHNYLTRLSENKVFKFSSFVATGVVSYAFANNLGPKAIAEDFKTQAEKFSGSAFNNLKTVTPGLMIFASRNPVASVTVATLAAAGTAAYLTGFNLFKKNTNLTEASDPAQGPVGVSRLKRMLCG